MHYSGIRGVQKFEIFLDVIKLWSLRQDFKNLVNIGEVNYNIILKPILDGNQRQAIRTIKYVSPILNRFRYVAELYVLFRIDDADRDGLFPGPPREDSGISHGRMVVLRQAIYVGYLSRWRRRT